ncbi:MAG TPA: TMEM175 family protein [Nocardioidaceae bacterium]|nr:TMEM175 family protein [Nocardioidaceae bacterium]
MRRSRIEAFSDGVLAIIITIMVLELAKPAGSHLAGLRASATSLETYLLSFTYIAIYWNNHHHLFHLVREVRGPILWANNALLFFLSLVPFTTSWMDITHFARTPVMVYGIDLLANAVAYWVLVRTIAHVEGPDSLVRQAFGRDVKGVVSVVIYAVGVAGCLGSVWVGVAAYVIVAVVWIVPDRRVERAIAERDTTQRPAADDI